MINVGTEAFREVAPGSDGASQSHKTPKRRGPRALRMWPHALRFGAVLPPALAAYDFFGGARFAAPLCPCPQSPR